MRHRILILFVAVLWAQSTAFAQKDPVNRLFDKYSGMDGYTTVFISSKMFSLIADLDPEDKELQKMMEGLNSIRILASEENSSKVNFYDEVMKGLPLDKYEELMVVKDGEQDLKFLVREEKGRIAELLLVGGGGGENVLISIRGDIDMKNIGRIGDALDVEGLDELEKIDEE